MENKLAKELTDTQLAIREVEGQIATKARDLQTKLAELKQYEAEQRAKILSVMEKNDIKKLENDFLSITYVAATNRMGVDLTKLKEEEPEVYKKYLKTSPIKASIRLKFKEQSDAN